MLTAASDLLKLILPDQPAAKAGPPGSEGAGFSRLMRGEAGLSLATEKSARAAERNNGRSEEARPIDRSDDRRATRAEEQSRAEPAERPAEAADSPATDTPREAPADPARSADDAPDEDSTPPSTQTTADAASDGAAPDADAAPAEDAQTASEPAGDPADAEGQPVSPLAGPEAAGDPQVEAGRAATAAVQAPQEATRAAPANPQAATPAQPAQPSLRADRAADAPLPGGPSQAGVAGVRNAAGAAGGGMAGQQGDARGGNGQGTPANAVAAALTQAKSAGANAQPAKGPLAAGALETVANRERIVFDPMRWGRPMAPPQAGTADGQAVAANAGTAGTGRLLSGTATVATTRAAQQPPSPQMINDQIAVRITKAAAEDSDRFTLQLKPANLGKIDVQMEIADGRLSAVVTVEKPETLTLLQRDARALMQALADAGFDTGDGGLEFNLSDTGQREAADREAAGNLPTGLLGDEPAEEDVDLDLTLLASDDPGVWTPARGLDIQA